MEAVDGGVQELFVNEKRIELEARALLGTIARYRKQSDQWLAATNAVNSVLKVCVLCCCPPFLLCSCLIYAGFDIIITYYYCYKMDSHVLVVILCTIVLFLITHDIRCNIIIIHKMDLPSYVL